MNELRKTDSRVRRTELVLHRSLASLIHEKCYDTIVVKEILARANVARSTFYAHFDGKEELLLSSIQHLLADARERLAQASDPVERLLYFSLPVLQHIEAHLATLGSDTWSAGQVAALATRAQKPQDVDLNQLRDQWREPERHR